MKLEVDATDVIERKADDRGRVVVTEAVGGSLEDVAGKRVTIAVVDVADE